MADKKEPTPTKEQSESPAAAPTAGSPQQSPPVQQPQQIPIDESGAVCAYANFCRVTGTPEELILDFGLNAQPYGTPTEPIQVTQRLVTNYYTAKRMLQALHLSVQRHEQAFGVLETDVQKRVIHKTQA